MDNDVLMMSQRHSDEESGSGSECEADKSVMVDKLSEIDSEEENDLETSSMR
jgi:hypothetical protein